MSHYPLCQACRSKQIMTPHSWCYYAKLFVQSGFNVWRDNTGELIPDPRFTEVGIWQAQVLRETFLHMDRISYILCSPLTRTIQTCVTAFRPLFTMNSPSAINFSGKIILDPSINSNTGSSIAQLKNQFERFPIDYDNLKTQENHSWRNSFLLRSDRIEAVVAKRKGLYGIGLSMAHENLSL